MSNVRMESDTIRGHVLFGCGIVLGVCIGFAIGHVTVWSRVASADAEPNPFAVSETSSDTLPTRNELERSANAASDITPHDGVPGPFFAEAARRLKEPVDSSSQAQQVGVATETSSPSSEPNSLPQGGAAPIDEETQLREQITRTIISQEMPQATPDEQEIWFDVLRGMEAADVKGILRMRKHVGGNPTSSLGLLRPEPDVATAAPPQRLATAASMHDDQWADTLESLRQIRDIHLHNLANAETIGFIRRVPVTREADYSSRARGCELVRVELDQAQHEFRETGRMLDVAVVGDGFFQVRQNSDVRLTRCGRLRINESRQLELATTAQPWRFEPEIVVPEEMTVIRFEPNGDVMGAADHDAEQSLLGTISLVTVDQPEVLEGVGDGLYRPNDLSGSIHPAGEEVTLAGHWLLLMTAAQIDEETARLDRVTRLINELSHGDRNSP
ncbi:MAG: flagellar hook basal-body protein [Planctomycetaceae bacterium]|nr:flagellar hook basal-body protein [Planctomycetaceae bacterium]